MLAIKEDFRDGPLVALFSGKPIEAALDKTKNYWEWERTTEGRNRVFFRDTEALWFQDHVDEVTDYLKRHKPKIIVGASRGGYAAILFAHLVGVKSISYSPQTILEDPRWGDQIKIAKSKSKYPDLSFIDGDHHIYYGTRNKLDVFHAERMRVNLHPVDCEIHNVARHLKKTGFQFPFD